MLLELFDCHMHSTHSYDSTAIFEELCESALKCGLRGVCVTEHKEFDKMDPGYGQYDYDAYMADVEKYRKKYGSRLMIKTGVEITYQTEFVDDIVSFLSTYEFDHVLGSVHSIDHIFVLDPRFLKGRAKDEAYESYWREVLAMVESDLFNCIGHLDYIKSIRTKEYGEFEVEQWLPQITEVLNKTVKSGTMLEVNTSAFRRGHAEPYPGWTILKLYKDLGGTHVVMGSDAHSPSYVGFGFREVAARLKQLGLTICKNGMFTESMTG
jgi:histidinol-phosphatase (PHP family)